MRSDAKTMKPLKMNMNSLFSAANNAGQSKKGEYTISINLKTSEKKIFLNNNFRVDRKVETK